MSNFKSVIAGLTKEQQKKAKAAKKDIENKLEFAKGGKYFIDKKNGVTRLGFRLEGQLPWVLTFRKI